MNRNKEPWSVRGRWYSIFIEDNNGAYKITSIDEPIKAATVDGNFLVLPEGLIVTNTKSDITGISGSTGAIICNLVGNHYTITLPESIDYGHVFVYGYFK